MRASSTRPRVTREHTGSAAAERVRQTSGAAVASSTAETCLVNEEHAALGLLDLLLRLRRRLANVPRDEVGALHLDEVVRLEEAELLVHHGDEAADASCPYKGSNTRLSGDRDE